MTGVLAQLGVVNESTYGTAVTPTKFYEFADESLALDVQRIESEGLRTGSRAARSDRFVVNRKGAAGDATIPVLSKGFGWWLKHMLGTVATTGPTDTAYTHTGTVGSLDGSFFTCQVGRPFLGSATVQPFTYKGCKIPEWELACDVDGLLEAKLSIDARDEDTSTGLASATFPANAEVLSFAGGALTIGGSSVPVSKFSVKGKNELRTDRHYLQGSTLKNEPVENGLREYLFELEADFDSLTQYNRYVSATAAGALAQIVATFTGAILIGTTTYPSLTITIPAARFDGVAQNVDGPEALTQKLSGKGLFDGTSSPVTLAYVTSDATP